MKEDKHIDLLFAAAREEAPKIPYSRTRDRFLKAIQLGLLGVLLLKWAALSRNLKFILMLSTMCMGLSAVVLLSPTEAVENHPKMAFLSEASHENTILTVEPDGSSTLVYLDKDEHVLKIIETPAPEVAEEDPETTTSHRVPELSTEALKENAQRPEKDSTARQARRITFELTRNIEDQELEQILKEAQKAGVEFRYSIQVWRGKVKKCKFDLYLKRENHECDYQSELTGNFRKTIGWVVDAQGMATELIAE